MITGSVEEKKRTLVSLWFVQNAAYDQRIVDTTHTSIQYLKAVVEGRAKTFNDMLTRRRAPDGRAVFSFILRAYKLTFYSPSGIKRGQISLAGPRNGRPHPYLSVYDDDLRELIWTV